MTRIDARTVPADPTSAERLAANGLEYRVVDAGDADAFGRQLQAVSRGFLGAEPTPESLEDQRALLDDRRYVGVFDTSVAQADVPVSTVDSWTTPLTVPGGEIDMWAISGVTVAGTHRRRGIARAMLEGELRAAHGAGLAIAGLTVSEATIYGRYGFGSAVPMSRWSIDTRKAGWAGPDAAGRVEFVSREQAADDLGTVFEAARRLRAGEVAGWSRRWRQALGLVPEAKDGAEVRAVRHVDEDGAVRGVLVYRIAESEASFAGATLRIRHLVAATDEARAALWRFALSHDLVATVEAELLPVDDAVRWMLHDERGATQTIHDHGWLRILDVRGALEGRRYAADADVVVYVDDPLGFASGTWRIAITGGTASVTAAEGPADLRLGVSALSSAYLGGVPLRALLAAGRAAGDVRAAASLDAALRPDEAPALSIWY